MTASAIYESTVRHRRFRPAGHQFRYRVFSLLVDLDELPELTRRIPIFSHNRFNMFSFNDRDHGDRDGTPLRPWFERVAGEAGVDLQGGSIRLLAFPRILGYTFNPLTVWLGYDSEMRLRVVLYEIHNTFGQQHSHLVVLPMDDDGEKQRHTFDKVLHVSPFFDQTGSYRITLDPPEEEFGIVIEYLDDDGERNLTASQHGKRIELTSFSLLRQFFTKPLLTLKVLGGIHVEAFRLWRKGLRYRPVPEAPSDSIGRGRTLGTVAASSATGGVDC